MDRAHIDSHHVVERYIADKLSEDERRAFEEYFIANPEIVKEIEAAARIKVGLHKLSETGALEVLIKSSARNRQATYLAMAASIVVVAIGALLWFGRGVFEAPTLVASISELVSGSGKPLVLADSYAILRTRGQSYDAEIELPASQQAIELRILPEVESQPPRYRVAIASIGDANALVPMGDIEGLVPRDDGYVSIFFDASRFAAGRYQLTLSGDAGTSAATEASVFRIRLKTPAVSVP